MIPRPLLEAKNLTLFRDKTPILQDVTFSVVPGSLVAVVGPNGGGKSTLLQGLANPDLKPSQYGGELRRSAVFVRQMAYLPQRSEAQRGFPLLVRDVVAGGLWREVGALRPLTLSHHQQIDRALETVGLSGFSLQPIGALSGGQFQRVLFARLIVQNAQLLLLDEPLTGVDHHTQQDLMSLIRKWREEGRTQLVVLHDLECVRQFFPDTLLLARTFSRFGPTAQVLKEKNWTHAIKEAHTWEGR